ncbi:cytochrome d ubiquinol oxidase subunit II [Marinomonas spartinae]|uniref:cytochrome d ubiquinol oxidase subunit II n=1 Tax=Marinomonas spartinae TaxID=1792290 RepID=UPI0018F129D3|nr:cytochrome d ubiquinol oxidase subunit II [Marinomonas spartinae]MBJ7556786.1 cytochrome d ubiquinol oxidase subunit II [Marinomonas spartinae]
MHFDLPTIWALVIGFGLMMYVFLDGFDLGIGLLFPFIKGKQDRDIMVNSVAPVWDGNETWLVLGGAGLLAAFPMAYSVILSALYGPILLMLFGLILRGVAFEFRFKATESHRPMWDKLFFAGSLMATFAQGVAMGAVIVGFQVKNGEFAGGGLDWLSPFSIFTGFSLLFAYGLLGTTWLVVKTEHDLQKKMRRLIKPLTLLLGLCMLGISFYTPLINDRVRDLWFNWSNIIYLVPLPVYTALFAFLLIGSAHSKEDGRPFIFALCMLFMGYLGLCVSLWPNIIPPGISIYEAAAPESSLMFTLVGVIFIVPVILLYTFWSYRVFRGKVLDTEGYH